MGGANTTKKWGFDSFAELQGNPQRLLLTVQQPGKDAAQLKILFELEHEGQVVATSTRDLILEGSRQKLNALQLIDFKSLQVRYGYGDTLPPGHYTVKLATNTVPPSTPCLTQGSFEIERKSVSLSSQLNIKSFRTWKELLLENGNPIELEVKQTGNAPLSFSAVLELEFQGRPIAKFSKVLQLGASECRFTAAELVDSQAFKNQIPLEQSLPDGEYTLRSTINTLPGTTPSVCAQRFKIATSAKPRPTLTAEIENDETTEVSSQKTAPEMLFRFTPKKEDSHVRIVFELPQEIAQRFTVEGDLKAQSFAPFSWIQWIQEASLETELKRALKERPEILPHLKALQAAVNASLQIKIVQEDAYVERPASLTQYPLAEEMKTLLDSLQEAANHRSIQIRYSLSQNAQVDFPAPLAALPFKRFLEALLRRGAPSSTLWVDLDSTTDGKSSLSFLMETPQGMNAFLDSTGENTQFTDLELQKRSHELLEQLGLKTVLTQSNAGEIEIRIDLGSRYQRNALAA